MTDRDFFDREPTHEGQCREEPVQALKELQSFHDGPTKNL